MKKERFYIDRQFGACIHLEIENGIVLPFDDYEYNGKLSQATESKPIKILKDICRNKLHKSFLKKL